MIMIDHGQHTAILGSGCAEQICQRKACDRNNDYRGDKEHEQRCAVAQQQAKFVSKNQFDRAPHDRITQFSSPSCKEWPVSVMNASDRLGVRMLNSGNVPVILRARSSNSGTASMLAKASAIRPAAHGSSSTSMPSYQAAGVPVEKVNSTRGRPPAIAIISATVPEATTFPLLISRT